MENNIKEELLTKLKLSDELKDRFGIEKIGFFGSFSRGEMSPESDLDILIEFKDGKKNFMNYMDLKIYLEDSLGMKIDLVIKDSLKERLKDQILKETIYAA